MQKYTNMNHLINCTFVAILFFSGFSCSPSLTVESPHKKNKILLELNENGNLSYSIEINGAITLNDAQMGLETEAPSYSFSENLSHVKTEERFIDETYTLPTGKTSKYINQANESVFTFKNKQGQELQIVCRAYNDGVAFRYQINHPGLTISKELTTFNFSTATTSRIMDYSPAYEQYFHFKPLTALEEQKAYAYPALIHDENSDTWTLLTEAAVYEQPATHLIKKGGAAFTVGTPGLPFTMEGNYHSPWRVFISGTLKDIVESVMVENLNPPSEITRTSWIEPGVAVFPWWGDFMANSSEETLKKYVDLAAEMQWEWIEFDVALVGTPFHTDTLWKSADWIPGFTAYAKSKGIKIYGWDEYKVLRTPLQRETLFSTYKNLGIDGIKIDFLNSDNQEMMIFREAAQQDAASHQLHVSFHGETIPRGQRRTYPNVMTLEGVKGAEYYAPIGNPETPTPEHNCTLPFTRNVTGPMDYTPVTFTIRKENPRETTYAHELALAVIFESGWQVMADRPEAYLNSPAREILQQLESAWDETQFIDGYPGEYICLARRKGNQWFVAAINAGKARTLSIPLDFTGMKDDSVTVYEDHPETPMTTLRVSRKKVEAGMLDLELIPNGGFCMTFRTPTGGSAK